MCNEAISCTYGFSSLRFEVECVVCMVQGVEIRVFLDSWSYLPGRSIPLQFRVDSDDFLLRG